MPIDEYGGGIEQSSNSSGLIRRRQREDRARTPRSRDEARPSIVQVDAELLLDVARASSRDQ
jgi:hypothetical protein